MELRDVFIAYHGTYDELGSLERAKDLFYFLESRNIKCYFFPKEKSSYFAETPIAVKNAKKFILVCNKYIKLDKDGNIVNNGIKQELQTFWNCIYEGKRQRGDARVYSFDGVTAEMANEFHISFQGVAHFDETNSSTELCFQQIYEWIISDANTDVDFIQEENKFPRLEKSEAATIGISFEIEKVFLRRSFMSKAWDISRMIMVAKKIECLGISNNELTLGMDEESLKIALMNGLNLELLFLDPIKKYTKEREREEKQKKNTIRNNTNTTLNFIKRLHGLLPDEVKGNLSYYTYNLVPRMNMIFFDEKHLLLQYYANAIPGASNPCFYIRKKADNQLYDFYHNQYIFIKERSKKL